MPEHIQFEDDELFNPETHHEHSDVPVRPLWWALIIFVIFGIVTHVLLGFMYKAMVRAERNRMEAPQTAVARPADADVPKNQPLLQPFPRKTANGDPIAPHTDTPVADLQAMRATEEKVLHNYGWVDRQHGVVHIPIDEAKDLLVAKLGVAPVSDRPPVSSAPAVAPAAPAAGQSPALHGSHQ